jgi:hypothetical protein
MEEEKKMNTIRKSRIFLPWQDEDEEEWLNEMAAKGLHLQRVNFPCFYYFIEGEPSTYVYRLDFKSSPKTDMNEYLQLFADAGWEHVGQFFNGWQYFRKAVAPGETAEIYSDAESKMAKYNRLMLFLVPFVPSLTFSLITVSNSRMFFMVILDVFLLIIYIIAFVKLMKRVKDLKKQI